jgi:sulfatase maturation enzyme AslB (radical SAM superfamily)
VDEVTPDPVQTGALAVALNDFTSVCDGGNAQARFWNLINKQEMKNRQCFYRSIYSTVEKVVPDAVADTPLD